MKLLIIVPKDQLLEYGDEFVNDTFGFVWLDGMMLITIGHRQVVIKFPNLDDVTHNEFEEINIEGHRIFADKLLNHFGLSINQIEEIFVILIGNNTYAK